MGGFRNIAFGLFAAFALVLFTLSGAQAATLRTINFEATGLSLIGNPFGPLGILPVDKVTGSFTFDPMATPHTMNSNAPGPNQIVDVTSPYINFSADIGTVTLIGAPSLNANDGVFVRDGIGSNTKDMVQVFSGTDQTLAPGVVLGLMFFFVQGPFNTNDGNDLPDIVTLNSMNEQNQFRFDILFNGQQNIARYNNITFSEVSPVPLPAALPLFLTMLAGMGALRWWKRRVA